MARTKQRARKRSVPGTGKRKRQDDGSEEPAVKRQETQRPEQTTFDEVIAGMNPTLMSDHWAKTIRKHSSDSSSIEFEDKYLNARSIRDTSLFSKPHTAKHLPDYIGEFSDTSKEDLAEGAKSSPHTLVITQSGIRAADLARELRMFSGDDVKIAKLFAKHMKLRECMNFVEKTVLSVAVGTPSRPKELLENGSLQSGSLKRIVIDGSFLDEKKRTIFDIKEVFLSLVELLSLVKIRSRLDAEEDRIEVFVF